MPITSASLASFWFLFMNIIQQRSYFLLDTFDMLLHSGLLLKLYYLKLSFSNHLKLQGDAESSINMHPQKAPAGFGIITELCAHTDIEKGAWVK